MAKPLTRFFQSPLLCICLLLVFSSVSAAELTASKKVVFLSPSDQKNLFFHQTVTIMQEAATDLSLDLEVIYSNDLIEVSEHARALLQRTERPDYLILTSLHGITEELMVQADRLGIHTLLFNSGIPHATIGRFRYGDTALKHWVGQVLPDDQQAGRLVAEKLVQAARTAGKFDASGRIQLIGLNGSMRSTVSEQREIGLRQYVSTQSDVHLQQVVYTEWTQEEARRKTRLLLNRFDNLSVVWAASDALALGAAQATDSLELSPGNDVFTAGVDWLPDVRQDIIDGKVEGTVGGHYFDGAWALIVIFDHVNGANKKFVDERTLFHWVDKNNVDAISKIMDPHWRQSLDYRRFSKTHNHNANYRFSIERILEDPQ